MDLYSFYQAVSNFIYSKIITSLQAWNVDVDAVGWLFWLLTPVMVGIDHQYC